MVLLILAVVAFSFYQGNDGEREVNISVPAAIESGKDAAAEVPRAADDATTRDDQPTTRPNSDGSTDKLDQKP